MNIGMRTKAYMITVPKTDSRIYLTVSGPDSLGLFSVATLSFGVELLGWPLKPVEKYQNVGSPIKAIRENIKYPRGLPRLLPVASRSY